MHSFIHSYSSRVSRVGPMLVSRYWYDKFIVYHHTASFISLLCHLCRSYQLHRWATLPVMIAATRHRLPPIPIPIHIRIVMMKINANPQAWPRVVCLRHHHYQPPSLQILHPVQPVQLRWWQPLHHRHCPIAILHLYLHHHCHHPRQLHVDRVYYTAAKRAHHWLPRHINGGLMHSMDYHWYT